MTVVHQSNIGFERQRGGYGYQFEIPENLAAIHAGTRRDCSSHGSRRGRLKRQGSLGTVD
jgi:hypothetical protein